MELLFTPPAGWRTTALARRTVATAPASGAELEWSPELHAPDAPVAWRWGELRRALPAEAMLIARDERELRTSTGWPLHLAEVAVEVGGATRELRLAATYAFFDHLTVVLLRAPTPRALDAVRATVEQALREARPRFRTDAGVAVASFWDPLTPATES